MLEDLQARPDASEGNPPAPLGNTPVSRSSRCTTQRHHVAVLRRQRPDIVPCVRVHQAALVLNAVSIADIVVRALKNLYSTNGNGPTPGPDSPGSPHSPFTDGDLSVEAFALHA